ncbi:MAG: dTMP kinase [Campylobacterales bacterium]|nr:dTMP kinase [Campylobacterales bacterium]
MYIAIEGIDTCGKSTQIEKLKEIYKQAVFTKEPGGTDIGLSIRDIVLNKEVKSKSAEMFLFLADRAEHFEQIIKPNQDKLIISDRSLISGIAYATHFIDEINAIVEMNRFALDNKFPDGVIFLKLSKEELTNRVSLKQKDKIENRGIEYMLKIQQNIKSVLQLLNLNYIEIDASLDVDNITKKIVQFLKDFDKGC